MLDLVSLRDLQYIVAVDRERSITRAAAAIPMAQPALSQAIARIERRLGVTLFRRTSRTVVPTAAGSLLADRARTILTDIHHAVRDTRAAGGHQHVRIHVTEPSLTVPRRVFAAVRSALPDTAVRQMTVPRSQVADMLASGELTLAVGPREDGGRIEAGRLCRERVVAVMSDTHPLAAARAVTPAQVVAYPIVTIDDDMSDWNATVTRYLTRAGHIPQWTGSSAFGAVAAADLTNETQAVFLAIESIARSQPAGRTYRPFTPNWQITWFLNWHRDTANAAFAETVVGAVRRSFRRSDTSAGD